MYFPPCSNFYEVTAQTHPCSIDVLGHQDFLQEWNWENWDVMEWIGWWPKDPGRFNHVATTSTLTWWCGFEQSHRKFPDSSTLPWNIQNIPKLLSILEVNLWGSMQMALQLHFLIEVFAPLKFLFSGMYSVVLAILNRKLSAWGCLGYVMRCMMTYELWTTSVP